MKLARDYHQGGEFFRAKLREKYEQFGAQFFSISPEGLYQREPSA